MAVMECKQYNADRRESARCGPRQTSEGLYFLPAETASKTLAEFVQWYLNLSEGLGSGTGRDYGGARAQEIRQSAETVMRRLMRMDFGCGDDLLFVCGEQADRCRECIGQRVLRDEYGRPVRQLCMGVRRA